MPHDLKLLAGKQKPGEIKTAKKESESPIAVLPETEIKPEDLLPIAPASQPPVLRQIDIDKELSEKKHIETEKITEEKPPTPKPPSKSSQIALLYQEAKSLYNRKFYNEALEKFNELLLLKPSHLRAKWFSGRAEKKIHKRQKTAVVQKPKPEKKIIERLEIGKEREAPAPPEKKSEEIIKIKPEAEEKPIEEPRIEEQKKTAAIEPRKMQEEMEKIRQEAAAQTEEKFARQLQEEEDRLKSEQLARQKLEQELSLAREEKRKMEEQIRLEREAVTQAQQTKAAEEKATLLAQPTAPPTARPLAMPAPAPAPMAAASAESRPKPKKLLVKNLKLLLSPKIIKVAGVAVVAGLIFAGLAYFTGLYKIISSKPAEQPAPPTHTEEILPPSLFPVDQTETITLQVGQKKNLFQALNKLVENNYPSGTFVRLLIKFTSENQEQKYASLVDLADALQIVIPTDVLANLENNYTLFLRSQKELPSSPFLVGLGKNKLGIVMAFRDRDKISQQFLDWQKTMPNDLDALFLGKKISFAAEYQFQEKTHGDFIIHSVDLPNEYSSLNYAFTGNNIIIATSLESIESLLDKMANSQ